MAKCSALLNKMELNQTSFNTSLMEGVNIKDSRPAHYPVQLHSAVPIGTSIVTHTTFASAVIALTKG